MLHDGKNLSCRESFAVDVQPELFVFNVVRLQIARIKHSLYENPQMEAFAERAAVSHLAENDRVFMNDDLNTGALRVMNPGLDTQTGLRYVHDHGLLASAEVIQRS